MGKKHKSKAKSKSPQPLTLQQAGVPPSNSPAASSNEIESEPPKDALESSKNKEANNETHQPAQDKTEADIALEKEAEADYRRQLAAMQAIRDEIRSKRDEVERVRVNNELHVQALELKKMRLEKEKLQLQLEVLKVKERMYAKFEEEAKEREEKQEIEKALRTGQPPPEPK